jgi:DNA modification methylase
MADLQHIRARGVDKFDPKKVQASQAKTDSVIAYFRRVKDWPSLEEAVAEKVGEQRDYVSWWEKAVRDAGQPEKNCPPEETILSADAAEKETGIGKKVVSRWRKSLADEDAYRARIYGRAYAIGMGLAKKEAKQAVKEARAAAAKEARQLPDKAELICADIADVEIEPGSIDIILTDPPYPEKYLPVYETLARRSNEWLKEGGSLLCMCGQSYFPQIMALMSKHMKYQWTLAYLTPGGQATQLWDRKVNSFWKPVLWFVKGEYRGDWIGDVARSDVNDNDKRYHHWGQSESGIADILDRFAQPGQTVFDPFVGGGTTAVVALKMGMRFIGSDIDQEAIDRLWQPV